MEVAKVEGSAGPPAHQLPDNTQEHVQVTYDMMAAGMEGMELDDDDQSDGGVAVGELQATGPLTQQLNDGATVDQSSAPSTKIELDPAMFLQDLNSLSQHMDDMWQLPATSPDLAPKSQTRGNGTIALYCRCVTILQRRWGVAWIPEEVRKQTPYSLVMLQSLRQLTTKIRTLEAAQTRLLEARRRRLDGLDIAGGETGFHMVETQITWKGQHEFESIIQENVLGLMLSDVMDAIGIRRSLQQKSKAQLEGESKPKSNKTKENKKGKAEQKTAKKKTDVVLAKTVADRVTKNKCKAKRHQERKGVATPANSTAFGARQGADHTIQPPPASLVEQDENGPTASPTAQETPSELKARMKREAQAEILSNTLSKQLRYVGLEKFDGALPKAVKTLLSAQKRGGLSRPVKGDARMPSERLDLNTLPTLHELAMADANDELAEMGQQSLSG